MPSHEGNDGLGGHKEELTNQTSQRGYFLLLLLKDSTFVSLKVPKNYECLGHKT